MRRFVVRLLFLWIVVFIGLGLMLALPFWLNHAPIPWDAVVFGIISSGLVAAYGALVLEA